jgi:hypothetical protein
MYNLLKVLMLKSMTKENLKVKTKVKKWIPEHSSLSYSFTAEHP